MDKKRFKGVKTTANNHGWKLRKVTPQSFQAIFDKDDVQLNLYWNMRSASFTVQLIVDDKQSIYKMLWEKDLEEIFIFPHSYVKVKK